MPQHKPTPSPDQPIKDMPDVEQAQRELPQPGTAENTILIGGQ